MDERIVRLDLDVFAMLVGLDETQILNPSFIAIRCVLGLGGFNRFNTRYSSRSKALRNKSSKVQTWAEIPMLNCGITSETSGPHRNRAISVGLMAIPSSSNKQHTITAFHTHTGGFSSYLRRMEE